MSEDSKIKQEIQEIDETIVDIHQQILQAQLRIERLQNARRKLVRQLPTGDQLDYLFH